MYSLKKEQEPYAVKIDCARKYDEIVNDVHSKLNATRHKTIFYIESGRQVQELLVSKEFADSSFCIAGGRHSMGGQQFLEEGLMLDTSRLKRIVDFCPRRGLSTVQSGMLWADLVAELTKLNKMHRSHWSIIQKPTGADDISIGGSLAANIHGRVLGRKPFIADIEKFTAILADGQRINVSRRENSDLFSLAIGGYGMLCFIEDITIKLMPSRKLMRKVELLGSEALIARVEKAIKDGALYGDFQFCIDSTSDTFLTQGILSTYHPLADATEYATSNLKLSETNWRELLRLAHVDKERAFSEYSRHYQRTHGQVYESETFQLSLYVPDYHDAIDENCQSSCKASEMITELYVPKLKLHEFLTMAKAALRQNRADIIYGTVRMIEKDDESFLPWSREDYACIIFNLHINHNAASISRARHSFRTLIDIAIQQGGSFYLTYHAYATRQQILAAYPQVHEFIAQKFRFDPEGRFASTWFTKILNRLQTCSAPVT